MAGNPCEELSPTGGLVHNIVYLNGCNVVLYEGL